MASLDNVRDLLNIVESQNIEYVLVTVQKNGDKPEDYLVNQFEWFSDDNKTAIIAALQQKIDFLLQEPTKPGKKKKKNS